MAAFDKLGGLFLGLWLILGMSNGGIIYCVEHGFLRKAVDFDFRGTSIRKSPPLS